VPDFPHLPGLHTAEKDLINTNLRYFNIETFGNKFENLFEDFENFERIN